MTVARVARCAVAGLVGSVLIIVGAAAPASAHTVSGQGATNYRTALIGVSPSVPGLTVKVVEAGSRIEVTWAGPAELTILGYQGEPYVRIGPDGVYRNRLSPATYLNVTRTYGAVPAFATASAPPQWVKLSSGHTMLWHDHRIHWMGGPTPPSVAHAPGAFHHVFGWKITMVESGDPIAVTGYLDLVPGSSPWPWVAAIVALGVAGLAIGFTRFWAGGLLVLLLVLVGADILHASGTGFFVVGSFGHKMLFIVVTSYYSAVAWILGAVAVRHLARRSIDGLFAAIFTALVIGVFGGLADIIALARSQVPFLWGITADRIIITVSVGIGAGVLGGSIAAFRINRIRRVEGHGGAGPGVDAIAPTFPPYLDHSPRIT